MLADQERGKQQCVNQPATAYTNPPCHMLLHINVQDHRDASGPSSTPVAIFIVEQQDRHDCFQEPLVPSALKNISQQSADLCFIS